MTVKARFVDNKCIMQTNGEVCQTTVELLGSKVFEKVLNKFVKVLEKRDSNLLNIFSRKKADSKKISRLISALKELVRVYNKQEPYSKKICTAVKNPELLNEFVEALYNYWRSLERFIVCYSENDFKESLEEKPYRVFNDTEEHLSHLVRATYRDLKEILTSNHCRVYRQVNAGCQVGLIVTNSESEYPDRYRFLNRIPKIRQVLLNPPLVIDPSMNTRTGEFQKVSSDPLKRWQPESTKWLCYPAKVGPLLVHIFFNEVFMELGCSLANLFELAEDEDLNRKPDAIYAFGVYSKTLNKYGELPTVFFDDVENKIIIGAIPARTEFGYFGYLKKMVLTLHNIVMMKKGKMPYHGAMVHIQLKSGKKATILLIGDTGAGKSETLEALRVCGDKYISDITIIADDMGSLSITSDGVLGYGTEIGAFVRLDDLQQGYVFGQIDRAIIMSPQKKNARIVIPVTTLANTLRGYSVDYLLYANNYDEIDRDHPIIECFDSKNEAMLCFSEGTAMSKGTTSSTGINHTYFVNVFGAVQYREIHDKLANKYFKHMFKNDIFVGQIRTRLGIKGYETNGPEEGARALLELISK